MSTFGEFLDGEIKKRNQSRREFAHNLHTTHDTLRRLIDRGEVPTLAFLRKLSGYIHVDLWTLLYIALPNEIHQPDAQVMRVAQTLDSLPEPRRTFFIELIENANLRVDQTGGNEAYISVTDKGKRKHQIIKTHK